MDGWIDYGWLDDAIFFVLFNSISIISGRCLVENERFYTMEPRLRLSRFPLRRLKPVPPRSAGQRLTYWSTGVITEIHIKISVNQFASAQTVFVCHCSRFCKNYI